MILGEFNSVVFTSKEKENKYLSLHLPNVSRRCTLLSKIWSGSIFPRKIWFYMYVEIFNII